MFTHFWINVTFKTFIAKKHKVFFNLRYNQIYMHNKTSFYVILTKQQDLYSV